jgi:hypothetical protein
MLFQILLIAYDEKLEGWNAAIQAGGHYSIVPVWGRTHILN